ncbi:helix-turn-helix domain-containing protein [Luteipulveratus sp. YIM 133132]|uniref:Helix-turn-helix domain-containing protein n=1 Tax=Luteipulveratus flavus TaxID=3031728 RepID=A0ABT6C631_9MICO|nr:MULTISPECIES: helix-turn-helix domain-containing protein [unclassified Luteipulveratus]MDE9367273.1 helix-turn-helix domain-containing protein [Luteipulveratus sp. YIM 133132]MDF8262736.1 helix-turn-helix domain-containing protein [Luteipulveratus sp. YIM 133296]
MTVKQSGSTVSDADAAVLHALGEPNRLRIVTVLIAEGERACGTFPVTVGASTLSHHFKILREAKVIEQRADGQRKVNSLHPEFLARFGGLVADLSARRD